MVQPSFFWRVNDVFGMNRDAGLTQRLLRIDRRQRQHFTHQIL